MKLTESNLEFFKKIFKDLKVIYTDEEKEAAIFL